MGGAGTALVLVVQNTAAATDCNSGAATGRESVGDQSGTVVAVDVNNGGDSGKSRGRPSEGAIVDPGDARDGCPTGDSAVGASPPAAGCPPRPRSPPAGAANSAAVQIVAPHSTTTAVRAVRWFGQVRERCRPVMGTRYFQQIPDPGRHGEFGENGSDVGFDVFGAEIELVGDSGVPTSLRHQACSPTSTDIGSSPSSPTPHPGSCPASWPVWTCGTASTLGWRTGSGRRKPSGCRTFPAMALQPTMPGWRS